METDTRLTKPRIGIRHLANTGFLISGNGKKIIIDGLYGKAPKGFSSLPEEMREAIMAGRPPYDGVTHILVSHYHTDHFDAGTVRSYLECHSCEVWLPDEDRRTARFEGLASLHKVPMERPGRFAEDLGDGDSLGGFIMRHSGRRFREMTVICYTLKIAGCRMIFLSDADFDPAALREGSMSDPGMTSAGVTSGPAVTSAAGAPFDFVFTNPLFLDLPGGREILFEVLRGREIVVAHLPLEEDDAYGLRDLPDRCVEAYGLPSDRIRILRGTGEVVTDH